MKNKKLVALLLVAVLSVVAISVALAAHTNSTYTVLDTDYVTDVNGDQVVTITAVNHIPVVKIVLNKQWDNDIGPDVAWDVVFSLNAISVYSDDTCTTPATLTDLTVSGLAGEFLGTAKTVYVKASSIPNGGLTITESCNVPNSTHLDFTVTP